QQILFNFLSNAVKFTPAGGVVTLAAALIPADAPARQARVRLPVSAAGPGTPPAHPHRLSHNFPQLHPTTPRHHRRPAPPPTTHASSTSSPSSTPPPPASMAAPAWASPSATNSPRCSRPASKSTATPTAAPPSASPSPSPSNPAASPSCPTSPAHDVHRGKDA